MRILLTEKQIQNRIVEMGVELTDRYKWTVNSVHHSTEPLVVIGVLSGATLFLADLIRHLNLRMELDFVRVSSYPGKSVTPQDLKLLMTPTTKLHDRHVLLIDDIFDSGQTIRFVQEYISWSYPESLTTAVLLRKSGKSPDNISIQCVGFDIENEFVVGYGLDYNGLYRNFPYIGIMAKNEDGKVLFRSRST